MAIAWKIAAVVVGALICAPLSSARGQVRRADPGDTATRGTMVGEVVDATSRRPVTRAQVTLRGTTRGATTDLNGGFVFRSLPEGRYTIDVRRIGYEPLARGDVVVGAGMVVRQSLSLTPLAFQLSEVTVTPGSFSFLEAATSSHQTVSRTEIQEAPFGEDLFRALGRLPGLSSGDYGAHFGIRGGRHDETLFLLDGLEIYEPFHLKDFADGALSIIDVEAIDGVDLLTGGFPARYGDKRSGVMNISSRTPNADGAHVTFGASFTSANALAEGTFSQQKGAWLVSGRRGYVDLLLGLINKKETKAPTYEDVFGTVRYKVRPNHALALNVLQAHDNYRFTINSTTGFNDSIPSQEGADNGYGNSYAWLTLRSLFGQHLAVTSLASFGSATATRQGDEHHRFAPIEFYGVEGHRDFTVGGIKQDFSYQRSNRMVLDWGYDARSMHADFDWVNRVIQNPDDPTPDTTGFYPRVTRRTKKASGTTLGAYVSDRVQLFDPLTLELGLRYDAATYTHDSDWSPRLHALVRLGRGTSLRAGWGQYRQRQGIADENAFDRLNRYFPSGLSGQWTLGFEHRYVGGGWLRAEAYHKTGSNLRPILRNWKGGLNVFPESAEDRILVYTDATTSKGFELYHERRLGPRVDIRAGYSLSSTEETVSRVDNVNDKLKLVFDSTHAWPEDQRHALNVDVSYRPADRWSITSAFTFHSGWPYTAELGVPVLKRNGTMDISVRPDSLYGKRLPPYQRMDIRATRRKVTASGEFRFFLELINLTNHENVLGYDVFTVRDPGGALRLQRDTEAWFTILPSLGVSWSKRF